MKFRNLLFIYLFFLIIFSACGTIKSPTYGPVGEDNFEDVFYNNITTDQEDLLFYSRAIWYPNKNGFKFLPAGKKSVKGVFVYTNKSVYFVIWEANRSYRAEFSSSYGEIQSIRLAANELLGRVVIKTQTYDSFEILGLNGANLPDKDQTEIAYSILLAHIEK